MEEQRRLGRTVQRPSAEGENAIAYAERGSAFAEKKLGKCPKRAVGQDEQVAGTERAVSQALYCFLVCDDIRVQLVVDIEVVRDTQRGGERARGNPGRYDNYYGPGRG